ncbi:MAG: hypothetical protein M5U18_17290 [Dehalococcoidia bacterium]|nr:hypothetical protein [Dehalococcoidia bacterium]
MFQEHALFPHMDVERNVDFGLRRLGWAAERRDRRVGELLETVGLGGFGKRTLEGLSGASASESRWPAPWRRNRGCSCSMSHWDHSTGVCVSTWW